MLEMKRFAICWALVCLLLPDALLAQTGGRYAAPVFEHVVKTSGIPFGSAAGIGQSTPATLSLDFYEPSGDTLSARPLVITVFGGAFVTGNREWCDMVAYCTRLAKHGYAAASIDYRLLPILSVNATSLVRTAYMASQDVSSAVRFFKAHCDEYRIDTNNIFLLGNSAGSIAILNEIFLSDEERPAETFISPDLGPMNSSGYAEYADFSPKVAGAVAQWGGVLYKEVIDAEEYVPLCMIHGTEDKIVPYDSGYCYSSWASSIMPYMYGSHTIEERLVSLGIEDYEFHSFEGEDHCFYITSFTVLLQDKFDTCFSIARDFLFEHLNLSPYVCVSQYVADPVRICPNPASDLLFVERKDGVEISHIVLHDLQGRAVGESDRSPVAIGHLPSGLYLVRVTDADGREYNQKVVVR